MSLFSSAALRLIPAALIINSGIGKLGMDAESSAGLQKMAATGIKQMEQIPSDKFGQFIGASELAVGSALAAPFVSNRLAGAALTAFGSGLMTMYFNNDENTLEDGIRPTQAGMLLAKDSWLVAIGLGLMLAGKGKKAEKKNKKGFLK